MTEKRPLFHVPKRWLLAIAGIVWLTAGVNVTRLGILAYFQLNTVSFWLIFLSMGVFGLFGLMFFKMSLRHGQRIRGYRETFRPIWHFFDLKSYLIMAVMMTGGIWLRNSGLLPVWFVAFFYTGLGMALAAAGILFLILFVSYKENQRP